MYLLSCCNAKAYLYVEFKFTRYKHNDNISVADYSRSGERNASAIKKSNSTSSCVNHLVAVSEGVLCRVRYPVVASVQSRWRRVRFRLTSPLLTRISRVHMLILAASRYVSASLLANGCVYEGNETWCYGALLAIPRILKS